MNVVFLGATRGMGRSLARLLAARRERIFLVGRDSDQLEKSAADLEARGAEGNVETCRCDLLDRESLASALDAADRALGSFDTVIVTAGLFASQEDLEGDAELRDRLLTADFTNAIHFCEEARRRLLRRGGGTLCVFSSVAGDRARKPVGIYGAAKAGLSHYLESLDLRFRAQGLRTVLVKPGFVKTSMTAGLRPPPFAGEPDDAARVVLRAIDGGQPTVYAPRIWRWILLAIRCLPRFVMRRISF